MSVDVDILTPADGEAGNPVRFVFPSNRVAAVAVWSVAHGRPEWRLPSAFARIEAPIAEPAPKAP